MKALGIDIGTTSICVVVYEGENGTLPFIARRKNEFISENFEQDPDAIADKVMEMLSEAEKCGFGRNALSAIGISSQMHGILYVNKEGEAVSPFYTWKDEKGKLLNAEGKSYEAVLQEKTGLLMFSGYGTVTHYFLGQKGQIPQDAYRMINIGDYIAMRLTGRKSPLLDESIAASFGGYIIESENFAWEKFKKAGIKTEFYPEISRSGEPFGFYKGIPAGCALGDNQASFYCIMDKPEEQININVGTGSQVVIFDERCIYNEKIDVRPFFKKGKLYVGASVNGGKTYERLASFFEETVYEFTGMKINAFEKMNIIGSQNTRSTLVINPCLYGSRGRMDEYGKIENLTPENFHPSDFIRAYVRGMAEELYQLYMDFPEEIREGRREIVASGNGIRKNRLMAEAVAERFHMQLHFIDIEEEAAAGAAKAALDRYAKLT